MSLLQDFSRDFSPEIRKRGEAYQRDRAVSLVDSGPDYVTAEVEGSDLYRVRVERDPQPPRAPADGGKAGRDPATYDCDCAYFAEHGPCKHCWATVLEAFEHGVLPGMQPTETGPGGGHAAHNGPDDDASVNGSNGESHDDPDGDDGDDGDDDDRRFVPAEVEDVRDDDDDDEAEDEPEPTDEATDEAVRRRATTPRHRGSPAGPLPFGGLSQPPMDQLRRMSPGQIVQALKYKAPPAGSFDDDGRPSRGSRNDDAWRGQLKRLSEAMAARPSVAPKPLAWPRGRRLLYVIDRRETLESGLTVHLMQETPKRDGAYERPRQLRITQHQVGQLPEAADRQIIQLLTGAGRSGYGYYYDMPLEESFDVDEAAIEDVLKLTAATGRCRLRLGADSSYVPVQWDDGPAWEFCLHIKPSPGGRYLQLDGMLRRPSANVAKATDAPRDGGSVGRTLPGAEGTAVTGSPLADADAGETNAVDATEPVAPSEMTSEEEAAEDAAAVPPDDGFDAVPLSEPHLLLHGLVDGFAFVGNSVARLRHFDAFPLITALRAGERINVPLDKQTDLLKMLLKFPRLPRLQLPPDLDIVEVAPVPKPKLKLSSPGKSANLTAGAGGKDALVARVIFDYDGVLIERGDAQAAVVTDDGHKLLRRDAQREAAALADLSALGFRDEGNYWSKNREMRLPAAKLPKAVAELTKKGWTVEADGKLYRSAGQVTVTVSSGIDWFELNGTIDFGGQTASLPKLLSALRKGEGIVKLDDGTYGLLPEEWLKKYAGLAGLGEAEGDTIKFSARQVGFLDALLSSMPEAKFDAAFGRARDELMRFSGVVAHDPPDSFIGVLRQYQGEGLGWMAFLRKFGFGGVLADDMGLGKTVQVLALLEARRRERVASASADASAPPSAAIPGPSLVVAPRSLVFNWKAEAEKFSPGLKVLDHTSVDRVRSADHFLQYDLVLTTYGTLRRDMSYFKDVRFDYAILDEAQAIKNPASESAKAARLVVADHRLALSGTPVQNHLGELWSLFDFLNPGMMGSLGVFKELSADAANRDASARELLARSLRPFILRRTKEQVAKDLPEKLEQTLYCELEKDQRKLYDELRDHYRTSLLDRVAKEGLNKSKIMVLEALLRLRQAACHPGLIDKTRSGEPSAKLETLMEHLAEVIDEGHKVLVFSQFTSLLAIVRDRLDKQGVVYEYLDGRTKDRQERVERFQTDEKCMLFLISLKAGGVGLNLTSAEYVFLLDPWWNPAVEAQAIDRAHRIGQTQRVFAYRLIAKDTVEEKVLKLQQTKKDLADAIINADNSLIRGLSREDLEMLLS